MINDKRPRINTYRHVRQAQIINGGRRNAFYIATQVVAEKAQCSSSERQLAFIFPADRKLLLQYGKRLVRNTVTFRPRFNFCFIILRSNAYSRPCNNNVVPPLRACRLSAVQKHRPGFARNSCIHPCAVGVIRKVGNQKVAHA